MREWALLEQSCATAVQFETEYSSQELSYKYNWFVAIKEVVLSAKDRRGKSLGKTTSQTVSLHLFNQQLVRLKASPLYSCELYLYFGANSLMFGKCTKWDKHKDPLPSLHWNWGEKPIWWFQVSGISILSTAISLRQIKYVHALHPFRFIYLASFIMFSLPLN